MMFTSVSLCMFVPSVPLSQVSVGEGHFGVLRVSPAPGRSVSDTPELVQLSNQEVASG